MPSDLPSHAGFDGRMALLAAAPSVLLVDDERSVRDLVAEVLGDEGFEVRTAPDGPAALEMLQALGRVDLLISDLGLPRGMNGRELAKAVRTYYPELPVVFITGDHETPGRHGAGPHTEVMLKPFGLMDMVTKVREILGDRSEAITPA